MQLTKKFNSLLTPPVLVTHAYLIACRRSLFLTVPARSVSRLITAV